MKKALLILALIAVCARGAFAQMAEKETTADYWVYVRLEDRSGVKPEDDPGRSKAGDVVAVLPVDPQHIPSETEKKEWMIYKASLTEAQRQEMLETWEETETRVDTFDILKEDWENEDKKEEFLANTRSVEVISENLVEKEVGSVITVSGNVGSISIGGKMVDLTGKEGVLDTRRIAQVYEVEINHEYQKPVAYRKNKLDTSKLGVAVKKGMVAEKIDASKIETSIKTSDDLAKYELKRKFYAYVQRPAIRLANIVTRKAFAETVSTINKSGEDYNTLTLWEDAVDGDLVTATSQPTAECYDDDGDLSEQLSIDGSTTNSSYYLKVTSPVGERHNGTDTGFTVYNTAISRNYTPVLEASDPYTVIEWMNVTNFKRGEYQQSYGIVSAEDYVIVRYNIVHDPAPSNDTQKLGIRIYGDDGNFDNTKTYGNVVYNFNGSGAANSYGISTSAFNSGNTECVLYSNTVYNITDGGATGINVAYITASNNISIGNDTDFAFDSGVTSDYNASSDATADGANSLNSGSGTPPSTDDFVSVTAGSEDLHLAAGAVEIGEGVDLSATFTTDIDGDTRSGTWDIGADEYVSAVATRNRLMIIQ